MHCFWERNSHCSQTEQDAVEIRTADKESRAKALVRRAKLSRLTVQMGLEAVYLDTH